MERYDVVIAGGGPAGSWAAGQLAGLGARVLVLEREARAGLKPCGGALTPKAHRELGRGVEGLVLARWGRVELRAPGMPSFPLSAPAGSDVWMVRRPDFDQALLERAARRGAEVHFGETALRSGGVPAEAWMETDRARYRSAAVISAEGAHTRLGRDAGLVPRAGWPHALALELEGPARGWDGRPPVVDFGAPGGYFWVFPKGEVLNVGVGSGRSSAFPDLKRRLQAFLDSNGLRFEEDIRLKGHWVPAYPGRRRVAAGPLLLVGDAAWLADPLFGEGIAFALWSGRAAARAVAAFLSGEVQSFGRYSRLIEATLDRELAAYRWLSHLVYRFPRLSCEILRRSSGLQALAARVISGERSLVSPGLWDPAGRAGGQRPARIFASEP